MKYKTEEIQMKMRLLCVVLIITIGANVSLAQMTVRDTDSNMLMQVVDEGSTGSISLPTESLRAWPF